jgi:hypothetical protein
MFDNVSLIFIMKLQYVEEEEVWKRSLKGLEARVDVEHCETLEIV